MKRVSTFAVYGSHNLTSIGKIFTNVNYIHYKIFGLFNHKEELRERHKFVNFLINL